MVLFLGNCRHRRMDGCLQKVGKKQNANIALEKLQMLFSKEIDVVTDALLTSSLLCVLHNSIFHLWRIKTAVSVQRVPVFRSSVLSSGTFR